MKKFYLPNTLVSELTPIEAEELKDYLMTCRLMVLAKFILQILDNEGFLSVHNQRQELIDEIKDKKYELSELDNNIIHKDIKSKIESEIELIKDKLRKLSPSKCEVFLADPKFDIVRKMILENENLDDLSQNEWLEIEGNYIRKKRREKLIQLNNIIS